MSNSQPWTVLQLLNWTKDYFERQGVESPRLCGEVLLAHVLGCERLGLYTQFSRVCAPEELSSYRALVQRAADHEPVAYLVGVKEFYSLPMRVEPGVLIPRPETELLVESAIDFLRALNRPATMWDVCTGSGCVAVAVAKHVADTRILATDIDDSVVEIASGNAKTHAAEGQITTAVADCLTLPAIWDGTELFDIITANPPYVARGEEIGASVHHEPELALYAENNGMAILEQIISGASQRLAPGGLLALEFGCTQADAVRDAIRATGKFSEPTIHKDHQNHPRTATTTRMDQES